MAERAARTAALARSSWDLWYSACEGVTPPASRERARAPTAAGRANVRIRVVLGMGEGNEEGCRSSHGGGPDRIRARVTNPRYSKAYPGESRRDEAPQGVG